MVGYVLDLPPAYKRLLDKRLSRVNLRAVFPQL